MICSNWDQIYQAIRSQLRCAEVMRRTSETNIRVKLSLDGEGQASINTGLGFFDHMLEQLGRHGGMDLEIQVEGDLQVDEHHTIEDTALALGEAFHRALGSKRGIGRYAFVLPMDDSLATVAVDFGGRPWLRWKADFKREKIGDMPTEMFFHFFKSFSDSARCNLSMEVEGQNEHHMIEGLFKAFARALGQAVKVDPDSTRLPSTKGKL
jgi:imidazoleglycerol-phosphate dehydratase/histidinol-phosphatase